MTDAALTQTPAPAEPAAAAAWLKVALQVGDLTTEVRQDRISRTRARPLRYAPVQSATVPASGTAVLDLGGPAAGREWSVRRLLVFDTSNPLGATSGGTATSNSGTYAAAAAGSIALPAGASVTGFDVTVAPASATVTGLVTVTGLAVPNLNYELTETTSGGTLSVRFPAALAPASAAATPQVNVPAITSGAAYALTIYGTTAASSAPPGSGAVYVGTPGAYGTVTDQWPVTSLPSVQRFGADQFVVTGKDRLFVAVNGATAGANLLAHAFVLDYPVGTGTPVTSA